MNVVHCTLSQLFLVSQLHLKSCFHKYLANLCGVAAAEAQGLQNIQRVVETSLIGSIIIAVHPVNISTSFKTSKTKEAQPADAVQGNDENGGILHGST
jgi:hypothetical protein